MKASSLQRGHSPRPLVKKIFRKIFKELLGEPSLSVLELRLKLILGKDPYIVLYDNPSKFCEAVRKIFGNNFNTLFKTVTQKIVKEYGIKNLYNEESTNILESSEETGQKLMELIIEAAKNLAKRITLGAFILSYRDKGGITTLIRLARANGNIEEELSGNLGWAVKIGGVIILGIDFADETVPIAMYSRKYARFNSIASEWIEETSKLLKIIDLRKLRFGEEDEFEIYAFVPDK